MFKKSNEQVWTFPIHNNRSRFVDEGLNFFKARSTEKATTIGRRLLAMKDVELKRLPNNVWLINGTVVLDSPISDSAHHPSLF